MRSNTIGLLAALHVLNTPARAQPGDTLFDEMTALDARQHLSRPRYSLEDSHTSRKERRRQHLNRPRHDYKYGFLTHVSGAKLARKAAEGTVGRAHLR